MEEPSDAGSIPASSIIDSLEALILAGSRES